jgi:hypothetical protein
VSRREERRYSKSQPRVAGDGRGGGRGTRTADEDMKAG